MKRCGDYSEDYIHFIFSQQPPEEVDPFINYVKKVKARFQHDQPEKKIRSLIRIAEDAIISEAARDGAVAGTPQDFQERIKAILGGYNDLIDGYNSLMPPCHQISLDDVEKKETGESKKSGFLDAMDSLNKPRIECGEDGFEENLNLFKEGSRVLVDVNDFSPKLTEGRPDLLEDVLRFMPPFEAKPLAYHLPDLRSVDLTNSGVDEREKSSPENIEDCETEIVRADESKESGCSLNDEEKEETVADTASKTNGFREATDFVNKLRIKCGADDYEEFLQIFRFYEKGSRNWVDVCDSGLGLTEGHPDLQEEFLRFMAITEAKPLTYRLPDLQSSDLTKSRVDEQQKRTPEKRKVCPKTDQERKFVKANGSGCVSEQIGEGIGFLENVKKSLSCEVSYKKFLKLFFAYSKGKVERAEFEDMVSSLIGNYPDLMGEFLQFWKNCESLGALEVRGCKEKDKRRERRRNKPIEELDLSTCAKCTPGYLILPEEHRNNTKRHKSQVLNDEVISVSSRLRGNSFKNRRLNQYENNLFECEDEQFELNMLLEWFKSADIYAEELGGVTVQNEERNGSPISFQRCIERLYGDQGVEVLDIFHKDTQHALPILRTRLQQKIAELTEYRDSLRSSWIEVYARNYHKSLGLRHC
jgi:paired amphipathic helix protein Sin3a